MTLRRRLILTIGSGSFVKPEYVNTVNVEVWGGGGAASTHPVASNGGAAGGQYVSGTLSYPTESVSIPFIVAGQVEPASPGVNPAVNGLPSIWDGGLVIAQGGSGSVGVTAGVGSTDGAVGDLVYKGGTGRTGNAGGFIDVYGGGGAGSTGNGNDGSASPAATKPEFGGASGIRAGGGGPGDGGGAGRAGLLRVNYNLVSLPTSSNTTTVLLTQQGSGTFVKPARVRKILVEGWGAGGRGAYATGSFGVFARLGSGGAGGNYARTLVYYPRVQLSIPYVVCTQSGSGFLSASIWNDPITNIPQMIATRGMNGPDMFCTGSNCTDINGQSYLSTVVATGSIVGCIGDVIYRGGSATSWQGEIVGGGGRGGGGAGSLDTGMDALFVFSLGSGPAIDPSGFTRAQINIPGESTDDFGGAGAEPVTATTGFAGGGGSAAPRSVSAVSVNVSGSLGGPGLLRLTLFESPLISKIEWNGNTLLLGYELDNATSYSTIIDGSQMVRTENGTEYSWIPNTNFILEGDVRWIPTTSTATQTGWDGAAGWRAFLEYARAKNKFNFYIDSNEPESIESYLVEPLNGEHSLEIDGTRRIRLAIRNTTTPYTGF